MRPITQTDLKRIEGKKKDQRDSNVHQEVEYKQGVLVLNLIFYDECNYPDIRSVNTMEAFQRSIKMNLKYQFDLIGLIEPFKTANKIKIYRRLGLHNALVNVS